MAAPKKWVLGVDPGYGNTGAVLRLASSNKPVAVKAWSNDNTNEWDITRSMSIAIPLIESAVAWVQEHDIEHLEVCIEYPVYNGNAVILMKQLVLYTMIQMYVYDYLVPLVDEVYLTQVNNKTSKSKLCGDGTANKSLMIEHSPFAGRADLNYDQKHTAADAFAHSLSAGKQQWALHNLPQYMVEANIDE